MALIGLTRIQKSKNGSAKPKRLLTALEGHAEGCNKPNEPSENTLFHLHCLHRGHRPRALGLVVAAALDTEPTAVAPVAAGKRSSERRWRENVRGKSGFKVISGQEGGGKGALTCPSCCGRARTCSTCYNYAVQEMENDK